MTCFFSHKRPVFSIKFNWTMSRVLMWSTRWVQLNSWAPPQILVPKCANHNMLATLHLGACKLAHVSNYVYARNPLKFIECLEGKFNGRCEHKDDFYIHINKRFTFIKIQIVGVHSKFTMEWQQLSGINTLTWPPNTTKTWSFPTLTFFFLFKHILIISKLHKSCVYE